MNESDPGPDDVGSATEEAAKLLGALSGWAREHGEGFSGGLSQGLAGAAAGLAGAAREVNDHLATGDDCAYCPVCRGVHLLRSASPEVRSHLASAASSLLQAVAAVMVTQVPTDRSGPAEAGVEHIDLDTTGGEWPEEQL